MRVRVDEDEGVEGVEDATAEIERHGGGKAERGERKAENGVTF
jgi:hypothetical protein